MAHNNSNIFKRKLDDAERVKSEARIQAEAFKWFHNTYEHLRGLLYHIPNGEDRDIRVAAKLKAMGVVAGIPDMILNYRQKTYFFEFKKPKTGKASEKQNKIHAQLDRQGFEVWLVESVEQFQILIETILSSKSVLVTNSLSKREYYYRHKIFDYLYSLGNGELIMIEDVCEKENQKSFISYVSEFIVEGFAEQENFDLLFTHDFKAFYKKIDGTNIEIVYNGKNHI